MTIRECAIIEAYTGVCMTVGENREYFYKYLEELLGRPVFTHELADKHIVNEIKTLSLRDFQELCRTAEIPGEDVQKPQDVVEAVRCKDCRFWKFEECTKVRLYHNTEWGVGRVVVTYPTQANDFCSRGERRSNG